MIIAVLAGVTAAYVICLLVVLAFIHGAQARNEHDQRLWTPPTDDEPDLGMLDEDDESEHDGGWRR